MRADVLEYWQAYYEQVATEQPPSRFAELVASRFENSQAVIDVGCGAGRDSVLFAAKGWRVLGLDASENAVTRAQARCAPFGDQCEFMPFDVGRDDLDALVRARAMPLPYTIVYARFFLHAIGEESAATFIAASASLVREGAHLCIECRTDEDADLPKVEKSHYRRFVVPSELLAQCRALGMEPVFTQVGRGLSPYGSEDPVVIRAFLASVG